MNETHQLAVWTIALNLPEYEVVHYAERDGIRYFSVVPLTSVELCPECSKACQRQHQKRWIEDVADLWALERGRTFRGRYHVLGGTLSALDGIGPEDLTISALVARAGSPEVVPATARRRGGAMEAGGPARHGGRYGGRSDGKYVGRYGSRN